MIAKDGTKLSRGQAIDGREMLDAPVLRIEAIEPAAGSDVQAPEQIVRQHHGAVAGQSVFHRVTAELRTLRLVPVHANQTACRCSQPHASRRIDVDCSHRADRQALLLTEGIKMSVTVPEETIAVSDPDGAAAVFGIGASKIVL